MAEFCLDCYNKMTNKKLTENDVVLTRRIDLCEGCWQYKKTVITMRRITYLNLFNEVVRRIVKFFFK